ncbi:TPA: retention module-containing protein, partial [Photobacterium damselae]
MENLNKVVKIQNGEAFILSASGKIVRVADKHALTEEEILLLDKNTQAMLVDEFGLESSAFSDNCISCIAVNDNDQIIEQQLPETAQLNLSELLEGNVSGDEIAAIQNAILSGEDPTQTQEAPAAGIVLAGSAIGRFITIDYDNDSMLAEAGFDTSYDPSSQQSVEEPLAILIAEGGEQISLQVIEGDLSDHSYPVSISQIITIEAGSLPLDPDSFTFTPSSLASLLNELSSDIRSGDQPVLFIFDPNSNSIVGTQNGQIILTIEIKGVGTNDNNADIEVITTIHAPIDHNSSDSNGVVTSSGDQIHINFDITGADTSGNEIDNPINTDVTIIDGQNPSFGTDSGVTINESTEKGQVIYGEVPLDVGSDAIDSLTFDVNQPSLAGLTSNGEPTSVDVNGNSLTVLDAQGQPVLTVTIAKDGSYEVKVTGPLDQGDSESIDLDLSVTATDFDGDSTSGVANITITDGSDAAGGEEIAITITEGDLDTNGAEAANPTTYPVSQSGSFVITAGEDRLVPSSVQVDPAQTQALLQELSTELTSGSQSLTFTLDSNGNIIGTLPDGTVAITVSLSAVQDGQDVKVTVDIEQNMPLDHTNSGDSDGFVHSQGDNIEITVPVQAQDTDGDALENSANVDITIVDGQNPSFGTDSGVTINESTEKGQVIHGEVPLDVGSDAIESLTFDVNQPSLVGLTSNGEPTTVDVNGNSLTVLDSQGQPVLTVTIGKDGSYEVKVTGPLDQGDSESIDLDLSVTATDFDGDSTSGVANITITDGSDAAGGEDVAITITEGDLDTNGAATGNPTTYPVNQSGSFMIAAGEDRLVPDSVQVDPAQTAALLQELSAELTSGGQALTFTLDSDGNIIGTLPDGTVAITVSLSAVQDGQDIKVTVDIEQNVPLDHTNRGDSDGFVHSQGDNIEISVPVQAQDTDGDALENSANVDITIVDGQNPSFGTDSGVTINESTEKGQVIHGEVPLDVGSDAIESLTFDVNQPSLVGLTSNGEPTTVDVNGNSLTVLDSQGQPALTVTIAKDGSYEVKVTGPLDQGDSESIDLDLNVTATDFDGDSTSGVANITITDGSDAAGGEEIAITITEGDLDTNGAATGNPTTYPVSQSGSFVITAGEDRLVPSSVQVDPAQTQALLQELSAELTSGSQALTFTLDSNGNIVGTLPDGTVAITVSLSAVQDGQDVKVTVDIEQNVPLDHTNRGDGDGDGFVHSQGDNIEISVPVQAQDTDGDALENSANVDITIVDGQNPSFGTDSGVTINESTEKGQVINGEVPLDVGSDAIDSLTFDVNQPSLAGLTSNGEPTSVDVNGNSLTVLDSQGQPVLTVTIGKDGSYEVKVTGPLDQGDSESIDLDLNVTATDFDGDSTSGVANITITDGSDAAGGEEIAITITEGDLDTNGAATGNPTTYPVSQSGSFVIAAGEDRLVPSSVQVDPAQTQALLQELSAELTSGGQALTFALDSNGNIVGTLPDGTVAITVSLSAVQDGQDIKVTVDIEQNVPLDHTNRGDSDGFVHSQGDNIEISVPVQAQDTDGDALENSANVDITIVDGQNLSFGTDSGVTINETTEQGQVIYGEVPLDVGSDAIDSLTFDVNQPSLAGLTSNGEPTSVDVNGNSLTVLDSQGQPVLTVTIGKDGSYEVKVTGPLDQGDSESIDLDLNVTATDFDGDSTSGVANITITDGSDAAGGEEIAITITEGDLDTNGAATGNPSTYPVSQSGSFVIAAGEDRLVPSSVQVDPAQTQALLQELSAELTSGSQALTFTLDSNGNIVGTLPDGTVAITVSLSAVQDGQDIKVTVDIEQNVPLDHTNRGDGDGFVHSQGDNIEISVPVQAQDTDGDALENSANVDITIVDGQNPSFGTDSGVTINESTEKGQVIHGEVPLDVGSDAIDSLTFDESQPSLVGLTSNGEPTTVDVNGNSLTVLDSQGQPVLTVTIGKDGSYEVKVTGPLDQGDSESIDLDLNVTATDFDGDSTSGVANITITDGSDAAGGEEIAITITEGNLDTNGAATGNPTTYPVSQSGSFVIAAGEDRLVPSSVQVDPAQTQALLQELSAELTSGSQSLTFTLDSNGNIIGTLPDGTVAITVSLSAVQDGQDIKVTVDIEQNVPLDHTNRGDGDGFVHSQGDNIEISVPVQAQDTDGDALENSANVDITIVDGQNPSFGTDSGVTINESTEKGQVIHGEVPLDVGSDAIDSLTFDESQPSLVGLTSNGEPTTVEVNGNSLTVLDAQGQPVLTVTIAKDGSYEVKVTGPLDQGDSESIDLDLSVTATDFDGDSTSGVANITITDGSDAAGGETGTVEVIEPDLVPNDYPVAAKTEITLHAGEDRLDPTSVTLDKTQINTLLNELSTEVTSNGESLTFTYVNGVLTGQLPNGEVALTITLTAIQDGQDVKVTVEVEQSRPLDHNPSGNSEGMVSVSDGNISIDLPIQATDTDGDPLGNAANVTVDIKDGVQPSFGDDTGIEINEEMDEGKILTGHISVDVGSDEVASIHFNDNQPHLDGITSNGQPVTVSTHENVLTLVDSQGNTVLEVTINSDGSYSAKITGSLDQDINNIVDLPLDITVTDKDGDSAQGTIEITITDGSDAAGGEEIA